MLNNKKRVFWEALLITGIIFIIGMFVGIAFESQDTNTIKDYYIDSEIALFDVYLYSNMISDTDISCEDIKIVTIEIADRIYREAKTLEEFEDSTILLNEFKALHRKYDLLRTLLWKSTIDSSNKCASEFDVIVYLYEYDIEELTQKATQSVWSKILLEVKSKEENLILIPIAADTNISSLNVLKKKFNITNYPALVVNNNEVVYSVDDAIEVQGLL